MNRTPELTSASIKAFFSAAVACGVSSAFAQVAPPAIVPGPLPANFNQALSYADSQLALNGLSIGTLPAGIQTVINNLNGYLATEQGILAGFQTVETTAANTVAATQLAIANKDAQIQALIAANPLDPQIAVENGNLAALQAQLVMDQTALNNAQADVQNSQIKIALYQQAINVPVAAAQAAAAAAAQTIVDARTQYAAGGSNAATGTSGLQSVIDTIGSVAAGNQAPVVAAIQGADAAFPGAAAASVADIQTLVGVINAQLPLLPPISAADRDAALQTVLNGAYERAALDTLNTSDVSLTTRVSTEENARAAGDTSLTTRVSTEEDTRAAGDASLTTRVSTEEDARAAGDVSLTNRVSTEESTRAAADTSLTNRVSTEESTRAAADTSLTNRVSTEEVTRAAGDASLTTRVSTEEVTRAAADASLTTRVSTEEVTRAAADTSLTNRVSSEEVTRAAGDASLTTRVSTEEVVRSNADASLTTRVSTEESTRAAAVTSLTTRVSTEEVTRGNADVSLTTRISTEEAARTSLIRSVAAGATGSTQGTFNEVHIGSASLVTYSNANDQQVVTSTEANGIRMQGAVEFSQRPTVIYVDPAAQAAATTANANLNAAVLTDAAAQADVTAKQAALTAAQAALAAATPSNQQQAQANVTAAQAALAASQTAATNAANALTAAQAAAAAANANLAGTPRPVALDIDVINEASARSAADTSLTTRVSAEEVARANADTSLSTRITNESNARIAADVSLTNRIGQAETRLTTAEKQIQENRRGIAMVAALTSPTVQPGKNNAVDINASVFDGKVGMAVAYARRINENVQVNAAVATTSDLEEMAGRAGVSVQW